MIPLALQRRQIPAAGRGGHFAQQHAHLRRGRHHHAVYLHQADRHRFWSPRIWSADHSSTIWNNLMKLILQSIRQTILWTIICGRRLSARHDRHRATGRSTTRPTAAWSCATAKSSAPRCSRSNSRAPTTSGRGPPPALTAPARPVGRLRRQQPGADQRRAANQRHQQHRGLPQRQQPADQHPGAGGHGVCLRQRTGPAHQPEAARLQIARVAAARGLSPDKVTALVEKFTEGSQWGFLGEPRVNVLLLNIALDEIDPKKPTPAVPAKT